MPFEDPSRHEIITAPVLTWAASDVTATNTNAFQYRVLSGFTEMK